MIRTYHKEQNSVIYQIKVLEGEELEKYNFCYPELEPEVKENIKEYHDKLNSEKA